MSLMPGTHIDFRMRYSLLTCFHRQPSIKDAPNLSSTSHPSRTANSQALPIELFTYIFTFCMEASNNLHLRYPAWLPITHVCHRWRTIALGHAPLWASIPSGLSLRWIKAFMERSRTMLIDLDISVIPDGCDGPNDVVLNPRDMVLLLADFTRFRSLRLTGQHESIRPIVDCLRNSIPIQSLSICLLDPGDNFVLPEDLFGGKASVHHLHFNAMDNCRIVAPLWLLRGVTYFTTTEPLSFELVGTLREMSALIYLKVCLDRTIREESGPDVLGIAPIPLPHLKSLIVRPQFPNDFLRLNQILSLPAGVKRRLELGARGPGNWIVHEDCIEDLSTLVEAANGFHHVHLSGLRKEGWFRMWTGTADMAWEDAEFCLHAEWRDAPRFQRGNVSASHLISLCDVLDVARVRRLVIDSPPSDTPKTYWRNLLKGLPGIEELGLSSTSADTLDDAWKSNTGPPVLPALRRVRIGSLQYAIIGDTPPRRIVRLAPDGVTLPGEESAENEAEIMSSGLLRLLQGLRRS